MDVVLVPDELDAAAIADDSRSGRSRMSCSFSASFERTSDSLRFARAFGFFEFSCTESLARLYAVAKLTADSSSAGTLFLISRVVLVIEGKASCKLDNWSEELMSERCERELSACIDKRLLCDDCCKDCGSVVVRSDGRNDNSRERYFSVCDVAKADD